MPVLDIGGARVVETGSVVMPTGVRKATLGIAKCTLEVNFAPGTSAMATFAQGAGPDDFIVTLPEPDAENSGGWSGTLRDETNVYKITILYRAIQGGTTHMVGFDYSITL